MLAAKTVDTIFIMLRGESMKDRFTMEKVDEIIRRIEGNQVEYSKCGKVAKKNSKFRKHYVTNKDLWEYDS